MRRKALHNGDGSHKRYETREEFEARCQEKRLGQYAEAIVQENGLTDRDDE